MNKDYKKLYEDALERAKIKRDEYIRLDGSESYVPQDIEYIFPELKGSEDERIRKELIEFVKSRGGFKQEYIAWLENQREQKPNFCHHEVDLSDCSEEYRKAYYDGWNNCNQQHAQLEAERKPTNNPKFKAGD